MLNRIFGPSKAAEPPVEVSVMAIAAGGCGKTLLQKAVNKTFAAIALPSCLQIEHGDVSKGVQVLRDIRETEKNLRQKSEGQTLETTVTQYRLCEREQERVVLNWYDIVGQTLVNIRPDSPPDQLRRHQELTGLMARMDVLQFLLPCPPHDADADKLDRFQRYVSLASVYLRDALKKRSNRRPCAIGLRAGRVDVLCDSEADAVVKLSPEALTRTFAKLVNTVRVSERVAEAAAIPVSSTGFNTTVRLDPAAPVDRGGARRDDGDTFEHPEQYILKGGATLAPFNVETVVIWTLLAALLQHDVESNGQGEPVLARIIRLLHRDLHDAIGDSAARPWYVPIKGRLNPQGAGMPSEGGRR